jgi:hypothetical protein
MDGFSKNQKRKEKRSWICVHVLLRMGIRLKLIVYGKLKMYVDKI